MNAEAQVRSREPIVERGSLTANDKKNNDGSYFEEFRFTGSRGQTATIELTSSNFDTWLVVYGPDGERVGSNDDHVGAGRNSLLRLEIVDGEYRVKVTSHSEGETGDFRLSITSAAHPEPIVERGALTKNDTKLKDGEFYEQFKFTGPNGERATIDLRSGDFNTYLSLTGPDGEKIRNNDREDGNTNSLLQFDLTDGEYSVTVTSHQRGETGEFELSITFGTTDHEPIVERGSLTSNDETTNDGSHFHEYKFQGTKGERATFDLTSGEFDTWLIVHGPDGNKVGKNDDRSSGDRNSLLQLELADGEYVARVTSHNPGATGQFELTVSFDRQIGSISLDQARKLVLGEWLANQDETETLNKVHPSSFASLEGNMVVKLQQTNGLELSMTTRSNVGVAVMDFELKAGTDQDHFQFGEYEIHFVNNNRFILHRPRHADVVLDRSDTAD